MDRSYRWLSPIHVGLGTSALIWAVLLLGYEPVGGDADVMYRPIKSELVRSLRIGTLPFWSDRFGVGTPLAAESHVAAFYPPNWVVYGLLDVGTAYRVSMWFHNVGLVLATSLYARALGLTPWGAALAGLAFSLCGFQATHACHEVFYHALPFMTLNLFFTERDLSGGARMAGGPGAGVGGATHVGSLPDPGVDRRTRRPDGPLAGLR